MPLFYEALTIFLIIPSDFQGKYDKAEPLYKRALDIKEKAYGPDHEGVAGILSNWGLLLANQVGKL